MCKKYSGNNVYVLEIHSCQYYVGCHTQKEEMTELGILNGSFNPLRKAERKGLITHEEYKDCVKIVHIEEFDSKEEAQNHEAELIEKFRTHYGDRCLNQSKGNKYGQSGLTHSEETRKKISENNARFWEGKPRSEETKKKIAESLGVFGVRQFDLNGNFIKEYPSTREASRQTGVAPSNIRNCIKGRYKSAGNSLWEYAQVS